MIKPLRISASDVDAHKICSFRHHLSRVLHIPSIPGDAMLLGSATHQCLEWIGRFAIAKRPIISLPRLAEWAWDTVVGLRIPKMKRGNLQTAAYVKYLRNIDTVLNSSLSPLLLNVLEVETKWELETPREIWGEVTFSGIFDLVHEIDKDTIEVVDWKTGKCRDFVTMKDRDMYDLLLAVQPRMYHMAATYLFPKYRNILITFYYIEDCGQMTIPLCEKDVPLTLAALWKFAQKLRAQDKPCRNQGFHCRMCGYSKNGRCDAEWSKLCE